MITSTGAFFTTYSSFLVLIQFILIISKISLMVLSFMLLFNGKSNGFFKSSHSLRQGDHISHSLFIIVVDYLSRGLATLLKITPTSITELWVVSLSPIYIFLMMLFFYHWLIKHG